MDNPKIVVKRSKFNGVGAYATALIKRGELVASFDGQILTADDDFTEDQLTHTIQFAQDKWRDSKGVARYFNHSCDPNCGIKKLFNVVAMRDIQPGEELFWDYEMTEDSDWFRMKCRCGTKSCRKVIGAYRRMPEEVRKKYKGFISHWLIKKYELKKRAYAKNHSARTKR